MAYKLLADVVLIVHAAFVGFVVCGLLLVLVGAVLRWRWIRNPWFRGLHLAAIGVVVAQAWVGVLCPLTTLEVHLRERAGQVAYSGSFVQHWLHRLIYFDAEPWVFTVAYTVFGTIVVATWLFAPPRFRRAEAHGSSPAASHGR